MEKPQQHHIRINSELIKKIKETLEKQPNLDQQKLVDLLQNDQGLRMKRQSIKLGVNEYFKKINIQHLNTDLNNIPQNGKNGAIDLTSSGNVQSNIAKKKIKKQFNFQFEDSARYQFNNLGGLSQIKQQIQKSIIQIITHRAIYNQITKASPNKGFIISGAVGTGKTTIANCILSHLKKMKVLCYFVNAFQFTTTDGDDKIKKLFQLVDQRPYNSISVICIDNIDQLCSKQNNKKAQGSSLYTLCSYIDKYIQKQVFFIATSSNPQKLDTLTKPGRFYKPIKIPNPTEEQRVQILYKILENYKNNLTSQQICNEIVKMTSGFVAVDIVSFIQQAANKCVQRIVKKKYIQDNSLIQSALQYQDFKIAIKEVQPVLKRQGFAKIPTTKLSDIGALQNLKEALINQIILPMKAKQKFKKINFQVNGGGVLLYGPPGCGKTMLAKGIANEANVNFITVKGPQLLTKYVGQSQQAVRKVFQRARMSAPCVIFFDQFDAIAPKRQDQGNQVTQRVVNTLLNELNGVDDRRMVFVIAATNRPDIIDEAVLRSGRIQLKLQVPMPSSQDRQQILLKITQKIGKSQQLNIKSIAQKSQKFSGADLNYLVKKAIISAISNDREGITNADLQEALNTFKKDKLSRKESLVLDEEQMKDQQYGYHPEEQIHNAQKKKRSSVQDPSINNEYQKNIKRTSDGILNQFIKFMAHSFNNSKKGKRIEQKEI